MSQTANGSADPIKQLRKERRYISPDAPFKKIKITLAGPAADQTALKYKEKIFADIQQAEIETSQNHAANSISFEANSN